jgi:MYXO-CTERM domain-containing protein
VVDYAYENVANTSIAVGAGIVPAPGAIALLGLAGLAGRRRR